MCTFVHTCTHACVCVRGAVPSSSVLGLSLVTLSSVFFLSLSAHKESPTLCPSSVQLPACFFTTFDSKTLQKSCLSWPFSLSHSYEQMGTYFNHAFIPNPHLLLSRSPATFILLDSGSHLSPHLAFLLGSARKS